MERLISWRSTKNESSGLAAGNIFFKRTILFRLSLRIAAEGTNVMERVLSGLQQKLSQVFHTYHRLVS